MDYEKFTFRIHEYCLRADCCKSFLNVIGKFFMIYVFVSIPFFMYGNYAFVGTNACLGPLMANYTLDFNSSMNQTDGQNIIQAQDIVQIRLKDTVIINNGSSIIEYEFAIFQFSGADYIVTFGRDDKIAHGFKYHDFAVDISCYASSAFGRAVIATMLDFNVIMMNEIMTSMDGFNVHLRNMLTNQYFRFSNAQIQGIKYFSHSITWPFDVFFNIVQILCGLFVAFTATALSIRILFQYIPAWIFYLIRRSPRILQQVIRHYSWIGIYFHTLQINGRSFIWILISLLMFSELFSRLRDVVQLYWQFLLFDKSTPMSLINRFYDLVLSIEILTFLFVRTRTSLKYLPRITIMIMLIFFYYFQHTVYGFYERAFYMMEYSIYAAFCYFLLTFELEALDWDPTHHYTPSPEKPRTLYFPTFSLTWLHDIPPLWTMFYPLFGKSHFSERELSLVNGNYELLSQVLQESQQRAAGGEEGLNIGLLNNNQVAIEIPPINQGDSPNMTQQNLMQNEE